MKHWKKKSQCSSCFIHRSAPCLVRTNTSTVELPLSSAPKPNCKILGKQKKGRKGIQQYSWEQQVLQPLGTPPLYKHHSVISVVIEVGEEEISLVPYVLHPLSQHDCSVSSGRWFFFLNQKKMQLKILLALEECLLNRENNYLTFISTLLKTSQHSYNLVF